MPERSSRPTLVILEPHLENEAVHPFLYVRAFVNSFNALGWNCRVCGHKAYKGAKHVNGIPVERVFRRSFYETSDRRHSFISSLRSIPHIISGIRFALTSIARRLRLLKEARPTFRFLNLEWPTQTPPLTSKVFDSFGKIFRTVFRRGWQFLFLPVIKVGLLIVISCFYAFITLLGRRSTRSTLSSFTKRTHKIIYKAQQNSSEVAVLVPTCTAGVLSELTPLPSLLGGRLPKLAVIFHEDPRFYKEWYRPLELKALALRLRCSGWGNSIRCFATNNRLARYWEQILGVPVTNISDVFEPEQLRGLEAAARGAFGNMEPWERQIITELCKKREAGTYVAVLAGPMREDKGAMYLDQIIESLERSGRFHFVLQTPMSFGPLRQKVFSLSSSPFVTVVEDSVSEEAYQALLAIADVVLLPYDRNIYAFRISRIFFEAKYLGKVIVASSGIAVEEEADGAVVGFIDNWSIWTKVAEDLLDGRRLAKAVDAKERFNCTTMERWRVVIDWIIETLPRVRPHPPVLYVRPSWFASGSATVFDQHLQHFAKRKVPILEVVLDVDCPAASRAKIWTDVLSDRAKSAAVLTCWSSPRSGVFGLADAILLFIRLFGRASYARQLAEASSLCPIPDEVLRLVKRRKVAYMVVNHFFHVPFVEAFLGKMPLWIETHDIQARQMVIRGVRNLISGKSEGFNKLFHDELSYLRKAQLIGAINVEEELFFKSRLKGKEDSVFLIQPFIELSPFGGSVEQNFDILIVASDNKTNVMNIRWFLDRVLPLCGESKPCVRIVGSIGRVAAAEGLLREGVIYAGIVDEISREYASAKVVALPVIAGAGIAVKGLEALSSGRPIVATPLAFRGLPPEFEPPAPLTFDPAQFAARILLLLHDEAARREAATQTIASYQRLRLRERFEGAMDDAMRRMAIARVSGYN